MKRSPLPFNLMVFAILGFGVPPAYSEVTVGGESMALSRELEAGSFAADSESSEARAAFIGFRVGEPMLYVRYLQEETLFQELPWAYEKTELSLHTHLNWEMNKKTFPNVSAGILWTDYDVTPDLGAEFFGVSFGGGITRFLAGPVFVNARLKGRLEVAADEEMLFPASDPDDEENLFWGYDAQAAIGFLFGRKPSLSVQFGYRIQVVDFRDRFIDDESEHVFLTVRLFVPSGGG